MPSTVVRTMGEGGVLTLRLNRPEKKNALTREMYAALSDGLRSAAEDEAVRVVLLAGGEDFTAGNDIADFAADAARQRRRRRPAPHERRPRLPRSRHPFPETRRRGGARRRHRHRHHPAAPLRRRRRVADRALADALHPPRHRPRSRFEPPARRAGRPGPRDLAAHERRRGGRRDGGAGRAGDARRGRRRGRGDGHRHGCPTRRPAARRGRRHQAAPARRLRAAARRGDGAGTRRHIRATAERGSAGHVRCLPQPQRAEAARGKRHREARPASTLCHYRKPMLRQFVTMAHGTEQDGHKHRAIPAGPTRPRRVAPAARSDPRGLRGDGPHGFLRPVL